MSAPKLVTVYGATGNQGGSVARSLLRNKAASFKVRGVTRNPDGAPAKALADAGVEVVKADGTVREQLATAFEGSWAVYANTNSDDPDIPGGLTELDIGKAIVDAAVDAGVKVFVYSGMPSTKEVTKGAYVAPAFEDKYSIGQYARSKPSFDAVADVSPGMYMENLLAEELAPVFGGFPMVPDAEGYLSYVVPRWGGSEEQPCIAMEADYGDLVHGVLLDPAKYNGRLLHGMSQARTSEEIAADFEEVTGKKSRYVPFENVKEFPTYGVKALETVKDVFGFCQASGGLYYGTPNDVDTAAELKAAAAKAQGKEDDEAKLMTLKQFFKIHFA